MSEKQVIGKYEIVSELGRGGMGVVYKAWEESLRRHVAIKMLGDRLTQDETVVTRFLREARAVADLSHPNVIQVFAVDTHEGRPYFAMEYIEGQSLGSLIEAEQKLEPSRAIEILKEVASGLGAAHSKGVVHRDIKPDNIMLTQHGGVKVLDFGIAQLEDQNAKLTGTGMAIGTPNYVSPEVCLAQDVDNRSDLFSLGVVFYEMLTGDKPFEADSPLQMMTNVVHAEVPDITKLNSKVAPRLRIILDHLLEKDPEKRYQSTAELLEDVASYNANQIPQHAAGRSSSGGSESSGKGWVKMAAALVFVASVGAAAWWYTTQPPAADNVISPTAQQPGPDNATSVANEGEQPELPETSITAAPDTDSPASNADDTNEALASGPNTVAFQAEPAATEQVDSDEAPPEATPTSATELPTLADDGSDPAEQRATPAQASETIAVTDAAMQTNQPEKDALPSDPEPAAAGPPRLVVQVIGDSAVTPAIKSTLKSILDNADYQVLNERLMEGFQDGASTASLSRVARANGATHLVIAEVVQLGTRTLTYYGNTDIQSLANLQIEAVSLQDQSSVGSTLQARLEYVALNANDQARAATQPLARQLVTRLRELN